MPVRWNVPWPQKGKPAQGYPVLEGVAHAELFHATPDDGVYCHHPHVLHHEGTFFAAWSNHRWDEDGPGQRVLFAVSKDGRRWSRFRECFPPVGEVKRWGETGRVLTANGFVVVEGTVYAIAEVHEFFSRSDGSLQARLEERAGRKTRYGRLGWGRLARALKADGSLGPIFWLVDDPPEPHEGAPAFPSAADPRFAEATREISRIKAQPLRMSAWDFRTHTNWTTAADGHVLCEPTVFRRPDGALVKLGRDKQGSRRIYAALSRDEGKTWDAAVRTNIPDSPSKAVSGTLPDGRIYLVGNQVIGGRRDPLVIALSRDGVSFDWAGAIRTGAPKIRHPGRAKGEGFQYPSAVVAGDALWVIYSIGKEDVAMSRIPLASLNGE